jgi:hypothetical protein
VFVLLGLGDFDADGARNVVVVHVGRQGHEMTAASDGHGLLVRRGIQEDGHADAGLHVGGQSVEVVRDSIEELAHTVLHSPISTIGLSFPIIYKPNMHHYDPYHIIFCLPQALKSFIARCCCGARGSY